MEISPAVLDQMADRYQVAFSRIQIAAEAAAVDAWFALNASGEIVDMAAWTEVFWRILFAASNSTSNLATQYIQWQSDYLGVVAPLMAPDPTDVLAAQFAKWGVAPVARATALTGEGVSSAAAQQASAKYIAKLTAATTRHIEQETLVAILASPELEITWEFDDARPDDAPIGTGTHDPYRAAAQYSKDGYKTTQRQGSKLRWRRFTQGGACGFCRIAGDRIVSDYAYEAAKSRGYGFHTFCRCGWRRVTPREAETFKPQYDKGRHTDVIEERFDASKATT